MPLRPDLLDVEPALPDGAAKPRLKRNSNRVESSGLASKKTLPPRPPSPPAGPPLGTYFSRRHATIPSPPPPASASIAASSMNCTAATNQKESRAAPFGLAGTRAARYAEATTLTCFRLREDENVT